jgi:hypothetical protein
LFLWSFLVLEVLEIGQFYSDLVDSDLVFAGVSETGHQLVFHIDIVIISKIGVWIVFLSTDFVRVLEVGLQLVFSPTNFGRIFDICHQIVFCVVLEIAHHLVFLSIDYVGGV